MQASAIRLSYMPRLISMPSAIAKNVGTMSWREILSDPSCASAARWLPIQETCGHRPAGYVATQLPITAWPGARSSGGRGLARPVVPGGVSLLAVLVSTRSSVVTNAASIAIITATAKSPMAVR